LQQTGLPRSRLPALGSVPFADRTLRGTHVRKVVIISVELPAIEKRLSFPCTNKVVVRMRSWNFRQYHGRECNRNGGKSPLHLHGGWVAVTNNNGDASASTNERIEGGCGQGRNETGWATSSQWPRLSWVFLGMSTGLGFTFIRGAGERVVNGVRPDQTENIWTKGYTVYLDDSHDKATYTEERSRGCMLQVRIKIRLLGP